MVYLQILIGLSCVVAVAAAIYCNATNAPQQQTNRRSRRICCDEDFNAIHNTNRFPKSKPGDRCAICIEEMTSETMHTMICGHALHKGVCYNEYRLWRRNCPYCDQIVFRISMPGDNCSICCYKMCADTMQYLKCEHALHKSCLKNLIDNKYNKCPLCLRLL